MQERTARHLLAITFAVAILLLFVWFQWELVCVAFAGALLAILLHTCTDWLVRHSPMGPRLSYAAILLAICGIVAAVALLIAPRALDQASQIAHTLPGSLHKVTGYLQGKDWGRRVLEVVHRSLGGSMSANVTRMASKLLEGIADFVVILVVGFFGAMNPGLYKRGLLALAPPEKRPELQKTLDRVVFVLGWWIAGQLVPMTFLAIASMVSLYLLGVKLAGALGLVTGRMSFIPYVGSVLAGIPSVLMALQGGEKLAIEVLILYLAFHIIEGYFLTPLVQKRAVKLPPAITILTQLFFWNFGGVLAVAVAAPAAAAGIVAVERLYLRRQRPDEASKQA